MGRFDTALHAYIIPKYLTVRPFDSIVIEGPLAPFHFSRHTLHSKSRSDCLALGAEAADWADGDSEIAICKALFAVENVCAVHAARADLDCRKETETEVAEEDGLPVRVAHVPVSAERDCVRILSQRIEKRKMVPFVREYEERRTVHGCLRPATSPLCGRPSPCHAERKEKLGVLS